VEVSPPLSSFHLNHALNLILNFLHHTSQETGDNVGPLIIKKE